MSNHVSCAFAVLCERALIDRFTDSLTLVNCTMEVQVAVRPEVLDPEASNEDGNVLLDSRLAALLRNTGGEDVEGEAKLTLFTPGERKSIELATNRLLIPAGRGHRWIVSIPHIALDGEGVYDFRVYWQEADGTTWEHLATFPLLISFDVRADALKFRSDKSEVAE